MKKKLGVIGGMGPLATAIFMELVIEMTEASRDSEHITMDIVNLPTVPDRTDYILGRNGKNPLETILKVKKELENRGCEVLAMPCNTAFYFYEDLIKEGLPIIHAIEETALVLKEAGIKKAGILATDGTVQTGLFQQVLERYGIGTVVPDDANQKLVMGMIYDEVKAGKLIDDKKLAAVEMHLKNRGADVLILGCTELSVAKQKGQVQEGYVDTMEVMARKAVLECGVLKEKYKNLLPILP